VLYKCSHCVVSSTHPVSPSSLSSRHLILQTGKDMATDSVFAPVSAHERRYRSANPIAERVFYSGMAVLLCACVYVGFAPTYVRVGMFRASLPSRVLHIHGAVFTLWMLLFVAQSALISAHRVKWHRSVGTVGFSLPPVMIVLGVIAAIDALHRGVKIGPLDPAVSAAIPLIGIVGLHDRHLRVLARDANPTRTSALF
jgi:hypothetical protein